MHEADPRFRRRFPLSVAGRPRRLRYVAQGFLPRTGIAARSVETFEVFAETREEEPVFFPQGCYAGERRSRQSGATPASRLATGGTRMRTAGGLHRGAVEREPACKRRLTAFG